MKFRGSRKRKSSVEFVAHGARKIDFLFSFFEIGQGVTVKKNCLTVLYLAIQSVNFTISLREIIALRVIYRIETSFGSRRLIKMI